MVSRTDALDLAQAELTTWLFNQPGDKLVLMADETLETPYAWVVYWNSQRWLETRQLQYALAGAGPFIISKQNGQITQYSSAYGTESALELYEEENQLYGLRVTTSLASPHTQLLVKRLAQLSPQAILELARAPVAWVARGSRVRLLVLQQEWSRQKITTEIEALF